MKKIAEKSKLINLPPLGASASGAVEVPAAPALESAAHRNAPTDPAPRSRTGVGEMMGVLGQTSPLGRELAEVKARLATYEGTVPARLLDPRDIRPSSYANRHASESLTEEFARLKAEIAAAGVNVQPIKVRPVAPGARAGGPAYEVVFGHRRLRACQELGCPVLALIAEVDDRALWLEMERENRERRDLSLWEQGRSFQRALQAGLFPSIRALAEAAGISKSHAARAMQLAELPDDLVAAFASPILLMARWATPLSQALQQNPEAVLAQARAIRGEREGQGGAEHWTPQATFEALTRAATGVPPWDTRTDAQPSQRVLRDGEPIATITSRRDGTTLVAFERPVDRARLVELCLALTAPSAEGAR
jgi:ParB family transcriptional regulator, chromosome partitioning protein